MIKGLALAALFATTSIFASTPGKGDDVAEFYVKYDVTFDSDDPQMEQAMPFLAGSMMKVMKNKKFTKTIFKTGTVSTNTTTIDNKTKKGIAVTESMMGNFYTMMDEEKEDDKNDVDIEKTDETKKILGYTCTKYIVSGGENEGEIELWMTTEITGDFGNKWVPKSGKVQGFPLQITVETDKMSISFIASEYKDEVPGDEDFSLKPPKGYDQKSQDELKGMMGGM